jgi:hypothetical protein
MTSQGEGRAEEPRAWTRGRWAEHRTLTPSRENRILTIYYGKEGAMTEFTERVPASRCHQSSHRLLAAGRQIAHDGNR